MEQKRYVIIGGVNGAGKSTLYSLLKNKIPPTRINTDEMVRELHGTTAWKNPNHQADAALKAIKKMREYFENGTSFNQETTLCGNSILKNIAKAKELGYFLELYYVGLDSVEIAKERVLGREQKGGHGIPEEDIKRRYAASLIHLYEKIPDFNVVRIFDNTNEFQMICSIKEGVIDYTTKEPPKWFDKTKIVESSKNPIQRFVEDHKKNQKPTPDIER